MGKLDNAMSVVYTYQHLVDIVSRLRPESFYNYPVNVLQFEPMVYQSSYIVDHILLDTVKRIVHKAIREYINEHTGDIMEKVKEVASEYQKRAQTQFKKLQSEGEKNA